MNYDMKHLRKYNEESEVTIKDVTPLGLFIAHYFSDNHNGPYDAEFYGLTQEAYDEYVGDIQLAISDFIEGTDSITDLPSNFFGDISF